MNGCFDKLKIKYNGGTMNVALLGEIDHHTAKSVRDEIDGELTRLVPKRLEFDLGKVDLMDSSGLGLILGRMRKAEDIGCRMVITDASPRVFRILDLAGVGRIITIEREAKK